MIKGLSKLNRKLELVQTSFKTVAEDQLAKKADEVVAMMKRLTRSKRLAASIGWTFGDPPKGSRVVARSRRRNGKDIRITIYAGNAEAFWARWEEFGTQPHAQGGKYEGTQHPGTRARPFFYPSFRVHKKRVKGSVSRALKNEAKRIAAL